MVEKFIVLNDPSFDDDDWDYQDEDDLDEFEDAIEDLDTEDEWRD